MKRLGTLAECKSLIAGRRWYHQAFDGKPMFIFAVADAEMRREPRKPPATDPTMRLCVFSEGRADWYLDLDDIRRGADSLVEMARRDADAFTRLRAAWKADEAAFENFFWSEFPAIAIGDLNDAELGRLWARAYGLAVARLSSSAIIDHFALGTDALIHAMFRKEASAAANPISEAELGSAFAVATAPVSLSFATQAEVDLLAIAIGRSRETLEHYQRRYFWIRNNFASARIISVSEFEAEIAAWRAGGSDLPRELAKRETAPEQNRLRKAELFRRHDFSPLLRALLRICEDLCAWQDARKRATYFNIHIGNSILQAIAARRGYTLEQLKWATGGEIEGVLAGRRPSPEELTSRSQGCVFAATPDGYYLGLGEEAAMVRAALAPRSANRQANALTGITASLGSARGKVRVIKSILDLNNVVSGDVLVAVMTRPDYVPGMRKAAAIVTDEGGITSHAAIISREFGIPCIIGTRIATHVLDDGDLVSVDGSTGTVTILAKAS
jgi:phosphohistidine swiveling domain-containing protein